MRVDRTLGIHTKEDSLGKDGSPLAIRNPKGNRNTTKTGQ